MGGVVPGPPESPWYQAERGRLQRPFLMWLSTPFTLDAFLPATALSEVALGLFTILAEKFSL